MWAHQPSPESSQQFWVLKVMAGIAKSTTTPAHMIMITVECQIEALASISTSLSDPGLCRDLASNSTTTTTTTRTMATTTTTTTLLLPHYYYWYYTRRASLLHYYYTTTTKTTTKTTSTTTTTTSTIAKQGIFCQPVPRTRLLSVQFTLTLTPACIQDLSGTQLQFEVLW